MQKVASVLFIAVAAVLGVVASMTTLTISDGWTIALFTLCGVLAVLGVVLMFWPQGPKGAKTPQGPNASVVSHNQKGGITAHSVNVRDEDVRER